jgi:hypothetical protein
MAIPLFHFHIIILFAITEAAGIRILVVKLLLIHLAKNLICN